MAFQLVTCAKCRLMLYVCLAVAKALITKSLHSADERLLIQHTDDNMDEEDVAISVGKMSILVQVTYLSKDPAFGGTQPSGSSP